MPAVEQLAEPATPAAANFISSAIVQRSHLPTRANSISHGVMAVTGEDTRGQQDKLGRDNKIGRQATTAHAGGAVGEYTVALITTKVATNKVFSMVNNPELVTSRLQTPMEKKAKKKKPIKNSKLMTTMEPMDETLRNMKSI